MGLKQKVGTAFRILTTEGLGAFFKAVKYSLASLTGSIRPDESRIAYQVLQADQKRGLMIDVGAHIGGALAPFANSDWQIYAFEPDSENRSKLETNFGDLPNIMIDPRAVADQHQDRTTLYKSQESTGMSGLSSFHDSHMAAEQVEVTTLEVFLTECGIEDQQIDFLKIDTEGYDLFVLKGIPWERTSPLLILCEFEDSKTVPLGYNFHELALYLQNHGYRLIVSEWHPIRNYGSLHNWKRFTRYPCELGDTKAWGNILAARDNDLFMKLLQVCDLPS